MNIEKKQNSEAGKGRSFSAVVNALNATLSGNPALKEITLETKLGADLGMSSIDVARFIGNLRKILNGKSLPLHFLFIDEKGNVNQDINVSDLVSFLNKYWEN